MSDIQVRSIRSMKHEISGEKGGSLLETIRRLWPYIWPSNRPDLKARVTLAMALLLAAKLATIAVPFTFKWATDALTGHPSAPFDLSGPEWVILAGIVWTITYGGMRIVMAVTTQARDGMFAKVAMNAVRNLALKTFKHMHELSLRFHLERKTGGLTRVLERGRNGIETIGRMVILQASPTIIELTMIIGVLLYMFDWRYVAVIFLTIIAYTSYTYYATEWRIGIRRKMNESDSEANTKAIELALELRDGEIFQR